MVDPAVAVPIKVAVSPLAVTVGRSSVGAATAAAELALLCADSARLAADGATLAAELVVVCTEASDVAEVAPVSVFVVALETTASVVSALTDCAPPPRTATETKNVVNRPA